MTIPILQVRDLSKRFGTLESLQNISFDIAPNEVVGLAGMSGSGKSVLAQIIAGLYDPSGGSIFYKGHRIKYPFESQRFGIEVVHQYPLLVEALDITSNVFLGFELLLPIIGAWLRIPDQSRMNRKAAEIFQELGVHFDNLSQSVTNLSNEQRQLIAIARAMVRPTELIFIDEPTLLISYPQQQRLLSLIQLWQKQGKTIILSSTNLDHLFAVTDRIIVLSNGQVVMDGRTDELNREAVVAAMVGRMNQKHVTPLIWALENYFQTREKVKHLYKQAGTLEQDLALQDTLNRQLVNQLKHQVRSLDQAATALQDAQRRLLTEREAERKHLSRELHDVVLQDLLSINYELESIASASDGESDLSQQIHDIRHSIRQLIESIRGICGNLRPPTIDSLGLLAAIQSHVREWSRRTQIEVTLQVTMTAERLSEDLELSIFRIIQESLSNIYRHASATQVVIELRHTSPRTLMIAVSDNGRGLDLGFDLGQLASAGHYGLIGISERVALLSGHLSVKNREEGGMCLQVEIPHPRVSLGEAMQSQLFAAS